MIKLLILGPPEVILPSGAMAHAVIAQPKRLGLLIYIACATGGFSHRTELISVFWPSSTPALGRNSLSRALSFLRSELGSDVFNSRGKSEIGINVDKLWCDAWVTAPPYDPSQIRALWRGHFLQGFSIPNSPLVNRWIEMERARIEDILEQTLGELQHFGIMGTPSHTSVPGFARSMPLVGRRSELLAADKLLRRGVALVTIHGPGGIGKTRLMEELLKGVAERYDSRVLVVSFNGPGSDAGTYESIVTDIMGFAHCHGSPTIRFGEDLPPALLVLDGVERFKEAAKLISDVFVCAPHIQILCTSRRLLNLRSEHVVRLQGLEIPPGPFGFDFNAFPATRMFSDLAERYGHSIGPDAKEDRNAIYDICTMVDGIPLAIEMAASWLRIMSPRDVLQILREDVANLRSSSADTPEHQRTFDQVLDFSWELLTSCGKVAAARLSLYHLISDLRFAMRLGRADPQTISTLTDHAFMYRGPDNSFYMPWLVREFLDRKLRASGEYDDASRVHRHHFALLARRAASEDVTIDVMSFIESYSDDIRQAWASAIDAQDVATVDGILRALVPYCTHYGDCDEWLDLLDRTMTDLNAAATECDDCFPSLTSHIADAIADIRRSLATIEARSSARPEPRRRLGISYDRLSLQRAPRRSADAVRQEGGK